MLRSSSASSRHSYADMKTAICEFYGGRRGGSRVRAHCGARPAADDADGSWGRGLGRPPEVLQLREAGHAAAQGVTRQAAAPREARRPKRAARARARARAKALPKAARRCFLGLPQAHCILERVVPLEHALMWFAIVVRHKGHYARGCRANAARNRGVGAVCDDGDDYDGEYDICLPTASSLASAVPASGIVYNSSGSVHAISEVGASTHEIAQ